MIYTGYFFSYTKTIVKTNILLSTGESECVQIQLKMLNGEKVTLGSEGGFAPQIFIFRDNEQDKVDLFQIYNKISQRTFEQRLQFYLSQIDVNGYFVYDKCRFYPSERKIVFKNQEFYRDNSKFLKSPGYIVLEKKNKGMFGKIASEFSMTKTPQFNTQWDTDVIFPLLDNFFSLSWKNS